MITLTTSAVIGDGISLSSDYEPLKRFIADFWNHPDNHIRTRQPELCNELARAGELFLVLFPDELSVPRLRAVPAIDINQIEYADGDYETETAYHQVTEAAYAPRIWHSQHAAQPTDPIMLHFAINRPIGALRGESDLASILPWLRRYARWLEDRVRLNAATRAYLWLVNAPSRLHNELRQRYAGEPQPGTVIIATEEERWTAVAPSLNANDASHDGRAIRWMIAAGGPGTGLLDLGEGEDSNQATGRVMTEQRRRVLMQRQDVFAHMLATLTLQAWHMHNTTARKRHRQVTLADIQITKPDISPEDNATLAKAATDIVAAMNTMAAHLHQGETFRRLLLRIFSRFTQETLTPSEIDDLTREPTPQPTPQPTPPTAQPSQEEESK